MRFVFTVLLVFAAVLPAAAETLRLKVTDRDTGKPIAVRMHLKNQAGRPRRVAGQPFFHDHFVIPGEVELKLSPGTYTFEMERGPEYLHRSGYFIIKRDSDDEKVVDMKRFVNLAEEGWYAGDLHVHRDVDDMQLLMQAEDLYVCPVITWWRGRKRFQQAPRPDEPLVRFDGNRFYHALAGEDEREGGAVLYFNLPEPLDLSEATGEFPSSMQYLLEAKEKGAWADVEKPFWWDVPLWLSSGKVDSIGLANNHMVRNGMLDQEAWGRPRDPSRYKGKLGNGFYSQDLYYRILNCGFQIPPSAGSASGVIKNPLGYNRVYVHVDGEFTYQKWWDGLAAGRCFVTNGPLLRVTVNGRYPGTVFTGGKGSALTFQAAASLSTREKIRYLEVIKNGDVVHTVQLKDYVKNQGRLPEVTFRESGWFLIRAITENADTFRFASTAPYYVKIDGQKRISRRDAQFFLDWVEARLEQIQLDDEQQQQSVRTYHESARKYWTDLVDKANAE